MLVLLIEWVEKRPVWLLIPLWILVVMPLGVIERILQNNVEKIFPKGEPMQGIKLELYTIAPLFQPLLWLGLIQMGAAVVLGVFTELFKRKEVGNV